MITVNGSSSPGLMMDTSPSNNSFTGNRISSASYYGIYATSIENSTFLGGNVTGTYTIYLTSSSKNNQFTNLTLNASTTHIYADITSSNNSFYWNNLTGNGTWVDDSGQNNTYNTSVGGVAEGNYYAGIISVAVFDSNGDGWADAGKDYPLNSTNVPTKWFGNSTDWGPYTQANSTVTGPQGTATAWDWLGLDSTVKTISGTVLNWSWNLYSPASGRVRRNGTAVNWSWINE